MLTALVCVLLALPAGDSEEIRIEKTAIRIQVNEHGTWSVRGEIRYRVSVDWKTLTESESDQIRNELMNPFLKGWYSTAVRSKALLQLQGETWRLTFSGKSEDFEDLVGALRELLMMEVGSFSWDGTTCAIAASQKPRFGLADQISRKIFGGLLSDAELIIESSGSIRVDGQDMGRRATFDIDPAKRIGQKTAIEIRTK